ncbi:MAG: DAK2 domain-containing protein [Clostridiales bacterium]|jgi:DAK2 domain fusion protein YloV|nr:DAK2 domain-containing protein [Clostridiales bacterium]
MKYNIDGSFFRKMFLGAISLLDKNKEEVDKLNVFPVPDGDTGSNMSLTMQSVAKELAICTTNNISDLCHAISRGALRGARGNSGVILSQICKGMTSVWAETNKIDVKTTARAIANGAEVAYKVVSKPQEGTILTVIRDMATAAKKLAKQKGIEYDDFLSGVIDAGVASLRSTPDLLPILKTAGVVDSGGQGLLFIFQGFYNVVLGREESILDFEINLGLNVDLNRLFHANYNSLSNIEFAYCTEFFVINIHKKTTQASINKFRDFLMTIGDCVLVIGDLSIVKVHVHTNDPGLALSNAVALGEINGVKIENMLEQTRELSKSKVNQKPHGMIVVSSGEGFRQIFKDLLVDGIVDGGASFNPSAEDIAATCDNIGAKEVIVLPSNKNAILAAEQSKQLVKNCKVHILPTANIPQSINAIISYNPDKNVNDNIQAMQSVFQSIKTGAISQAVKTTNVNSIDINTDDYIGIVGNSINIKSDTLTDATIQLVDSIINTNTSNITLYYGSLVELDNAQRLIKDIATQYPNHDVDLQFGGQDLYHYIVSVE